MKMWLVTWESINQEHRIKDKIAAIYNPRWSSDRVELAVELLHAASQYTVSEQLQYANNKKFNPYPANSYNSPGIPFRITCGHNPYLEARRVSNLKVTLDAEGNEVVSWTESLANGGSCEEVVTVKK